MAARPVSVGLVGCGWISEIVHLPNLVASPRATVVALADPSDERRARAMRLVPGARAFSDASDLVSDPAVEAVVIAVPPSAAPGLAISALGAGKHVYLEKPGAGSITEIDAIRAAIGEASPSFVIGYNFRRNEAVERALALVRSGGIGDLVAIQSVFTWSSGAPGGWRADRGSGGALLDLGSHHIDLSFLFADAGIAHAQALRRSLQWPDDTVDLLLRFDNGVTSSIHVSSSEGRNANALRLFGRKGHLEVDLAGTAKVRVLQGDPPRSRIDRLADRIARFDAAGLVKSGAERSFARLLDDWLATCRDGRQRGPGIEDAASVLRTIEMVRN